MIKQASLFGAALLMLLAVISGCAPAASQTESENEEVEPTQAETEEVAPTLTHTPRPNSTSRPTSAPEPTATRTPRPTDPPRPSNTPAPTATARPSTSVPPTTQPTSGATATTPPLAEFVPPGESIWVLDTEPSETGTAAACPGPFYADFYGLVQVVTIDGGITWMRAQDGITYTLLWQSPNVYWGTGGSIYPGYTLTISVVFTSPTGLGATFVLIDQNIQGCNHFWRYGGTLR